MKKSSLALAVAIAGCSSSGEPARIVLGTADTVIVNNIRAVRLPVRVLNQEGEALPDSGVRFEWLSGDRVSIDQHGVVTCTRAADATIRARLDRISAEGLLQCRPVERVRMDAPIQFIIPGDTAQSVRVDARDENGDRVTLLSGSLTIRDTTVATIDGERVLPRSPP